VIAEPLKANPWIRLTSCVRARTSWSRWPLNSFSSTRTSVRCGEQRPSPRAATRANGERVSRVRYRGSHTGAYLEAELQWSRRGPSGRESLGAWRAF
jgi:hypothetical protein